MKKSFLLLLTLFAAGAASAQSRFAHDWQGKLAVNGISLRVVFHIRQSGDTLSATMESPDQGGKAFPFASAAAQGDSIILLQPRIMGAFRGSLKGGDTVLEGLWVQNDVPFPLTLYKAAPGTDFSRRRPQEPKPPFPYKTEDVSYPGGAQDVRLAGTLTLPEGSGRHPALLLVTGSGPQNRDEEVLGHKPFLLMADYLTRQGYVVLRVDDRGVGSSTGSRLQSTTADYARDASAGIDFLKSRPEVDEQKVGLLGHSEGGLIAEMLAARRSDVAFIILMAAPGVPNAQLMAEQNQAIIKQSGKLSDADNAAYIRLYKAVMQQAASPLEGAALRRALEDAVTRWKATLDTAGIVRITGIHNEETQAAFVDAFMKEHTPWTQYFFNSNPQQYLKKIKCRVLALNGSKDVQVLPGSNLAGIAAALKSGGNRHYKTEALPGLNHLFQTCATGLPDEYSELEETMAPIALEAIGTWLAKEVKR